MKKIIETEPMQTEDLIDLGTASAETKGGSQVIQFDNPQSNYRQLPGLSAD